ncbi:MULTISPECIES: DUF5667 domain-containing protein [Streptomyces]|uniref:DUF5667 domain-containing protein n=1 Tax=Streptomyces lichenis TaxID=2306967 RepID=A0ABT0III4_9ACTN|nr:DUF5667 domain-containing protein [Streptomyces lichenis]MCK8681140.1 DUF5667 domain-containing protein [Streptomyces lichenis]
MIANVSAHRRANAFAQALEEQSATPSGTPAEPTAEPSAESAGQGRLLALASGLGELPKPELDPEVKVVQRAQLVAAMEAMFAEGGASAGPTVPPQRARGGRGAHRATGLRRLRPRSRWSKGLAAGGLTVGVAAGAFSGVAAASSDALPGDSLYGLKRGMEDLKLGMADGDADRGEIYLDQASTRLSEARRLLERDRAGALDHESLGEIRRALSGMQHDAAEGHRLLRLAYERDGAIAPMATLSSFTRSHRDTWNGLRDRLPVQLTDVGNQVSDVFAAMDEDVQPLQAKLPQPPQRGGTGGRTSSRPPSGATQDAPGSTERPDEQSPTAPEARPTGSSPSSPGKPGPTGSRPTEDDGLLGNAPGGILQPDRDTPPPSGSGGDGGGGTGGRDTPDPAPDITIPPLLPGIIPGLGFEQDEER